MQDAEVPPRIHVVRLDEALTFINVDYVKVRPGWLTHAGGEGVVG